MKIKIIKAEEWNWYKDKIGTIYHIKDKDKYGNLGVQVYKENNDITPDVVEHRHYKYVE